MVRPLIILSFCIYACGNNKAEQAAPAPLPPKYYFYPKANLYFDTVNKDYVFQSNDGKAWVSQKQIPAALQAMMDKMVLLDTFSQPVWTNNDNHKLVYSALLYATPNDTVERKEVVVQKPVTDTVKKEKKGLAKFFDKLFGRKKKNKEQQKN